MIDSAAWEAANARHLWAALSWLKLCLEQGVGEKRPHAKLAAAADASQRLKQMQACRRR